MTVVSLRRIGGSECAAAAGIDPHTSAAMLWAYKTGRAEREPSEAMHWGHLLEPVVYASLDYDVMPAPADGFTDPEWPWVVGHPDGFVDIDGERGLLEVKTMGYWSHRASDNGDGTIPIAHEAQIQWYLHLTGLNVALWACLIGGQRLEARTVERNQDAIDALLTYCAHFHTLLTRDEPPPFRADDAEALRAIFPHAEPGKVKRADKEAMRHYHALLAIREQEKATKEQRGEHEHWLRGFMGDAETLRTPYDVDIIRWKDTASHGWPKGTTDRFRKDHPDLYEEYATDTQTRRMTLV